MPENKTKSTRQSPHAFLRQVENERRRRDGGELLRLLQELTGEPPKMWGPSIIGFGQYHYRYASGREGDSMLVGFSPRKQSLVLYLGPGLSNDHLLAKLGKHNTGKGCLYINKLDDIDRNILRELVQKSVDEMRQRYA